ncbi:MAG: GNAT family N-acetyltransferase [Maritimibacter sp.]|nr:GNAT family N-acetyltransferase [Maritimibacter sp.]
MIALRPATPGDAEAMARIQAGIFAARGFGPQGDAAWTRARYIEHDDSLACTLACDGDIVLGFQSLKRAGPGNVYDLPEGWGIIGTHIALSAGRRGIGRALFATSLAAARAAGLGTIDATIGAENAGALGYYEAMGFVDWRRLDGAVGKRFDLAPVG